MDASDQAADIADYELAHGIHPPPPSPEEMRNQFEQRMAEARALKEAHKERRHG